MSWDPCCLNPRWYEKAVVSDKIKSDLDRQDVYTCYFLPYEQWAEDFSRTLKGRGWLYKLRFCYNWEKNSWRSGSVDRTRRIGQKLCSCISSIGLPYLMVGIDFSRIKATISTLQSIFGNGFLLTMLVRCTVQAVSMNIILLKSRCLFWCSTFFTMRVSFRVLMTLKKSFMKSRVDYRLKYFEHLWPACSTTAFMLRLFKLSQPSIKVLEYSFFINIWLKSLVCTCNLIKLMFCNSSSYYQPV